MGSIFWREQEITTVFEQTEDMFIENGGGMALFDMTESPPRIIPVEKIYLRRGDPEAMFKLMKRDSAALNRTGS